MNSSKDKKEQDVEESPGSAEESAEESTEESVEEEPEVVDDDREDDEVVRDPNETIAELEQKLEAEHQRLLRAAADLDNLRKRTRRDVDDAAIRGRIEVLGELLPAIDSLDLALSSSEREGPAGPVLDGVEMVRKQFLAAMSRFGLAPVETAPGDPFDPAVQEAVAQIPSADYELGAVVEVMRKGYVLGERLVRASMVVVSAGEAESPPAAEEAAEANVPDTEDNDG